MGSSDSSYHRALLTAYEIVGSETALAARFNCPVGQVLSWLRGHSPVPMSVFLTCADIIVIHNNLKMLEYMAQTDEVRRRQGR